MSPNEQAILRAEAERGDLIAECHSLIVAIAYKPSCLKLLGLARNYLKMLASYKSHWRQQRSRRE